MQSLASWAFGDFIFNVESDAFFDVNKATCFGFREMNLDTGKETIKLMITLGEQRIIHFESTMDELRNSVMAACNACHSNVNYCLLFGRVCQCRQIGIEILLF
jgi:hypothetical protein